MFRKTWPKSTTNQVLAKIHFQKKGNDMIDWITKAGLVTLNSRSICPTYEAAAITLESEIRNS